MTMQLGKLLEDVIGMDPSVLGEKTLARALRERMSACKLADEEQYLARARSSSREMEALIEAVVVPETSFFRDAGPFDFLCRYVRDEWVPGRGTEPLRILSAPCSSGEEPYSIAMVLQEAGLKPDRYGIDALDISRALLRKAERAAYTPHSFRGVPESIRDRYFVPVERQYVLKDTVRCGVRFVHGNLLDESVLAGKQPYDIIFCRNLLIYLGARARARMVKTIERLMMPNGLLFVGHAETSCFPAAKFAPLDRRRAFGFRKMKPDAAAIPALVESASTAKVVAPTPALTMPQPPQGMRQRLARAPELPEAKDSYETARQMADKGRLSEAAVMCERLLLHDRANADIHCLLGAVLHGLGNLQRAEECFTRAIYLDEHCHDAVVHLSLIKEHQGDSAGAAVLRRRAARIRQYARTS